MMDGTRARVAAVVGAASKNGSISHVYDYQNGGYWNASASVRSGSVSGYDYTSSSHFSGSNSGGGALNFYDYGTSGHVHLTLNGNSFSGYDYHTGSHFSGTVSGSSISIYDYGTGSYFNYSV